MTPLDRISQLTDENAQLRADLARVTAERDRWAHDYSEKYDETRDLRARVADLEAAESLHWITEEELRQSRARVAELVAALRELHWRFPISLSQHDLPAGIIDHPSPYLRAAIDQARAAK